MKTVKKRSGDETIQRKSDSRSVEQKLDTCLAMNNLIFMLVIKSPVASREGEMPSIIDG